MGNVDIKRPEGCKNLHLSKQNEANGLINFGVPKRYRGLENIDYAYGYAEAQAYSDNQMDTNKRKPSFADITILLAQLIASDEAEITGKTYIKGKKFTSTSDKAPKYAVMWEQTNSDGTSTFFCFYNVTLSKEGGTNSTIGDSITYDSITLVGKAIPLSNGDLDLTLESDDPEVIQSEITNFFKKVILRADAEAGAGGETARIVNPIMDDLGLIGDTTETEQALNTVKRKIKE